MQGDYFSIFFQKNFGSVWEPFVSAFLVELANKLRALLELCPDLGCPLDGL